jgi:hypothetical protein
MTQFSQFKVYSLGTVAANKLLKSNEIEVVPIETAPMHHGDLSDAVNNYGAQSTDQQGAAYQVEVQTTASIRATWLPIGSSNRLTAPDVRRGATVILYQFADTDQYWWTTLKDDMYLRKLETVIYGFSATRDENAKPSPDNMYFLEISTHQKVVHFHTSRADGEPFAYDIQINTAEGCITIQDDTGNVFFLDSPEKRLKMQNADGSFVDIDKRSIWMSAPDLIRQTGKQLVQEFETIQTTASVSIGIETPETTHVGNQTTIGNFTGMKNADGGGGEMSIEGNTKMKGGMAITDSLVVGQQILAKQITSTEPIVAPNVP